MRELGGAVLASELQGVLGKTGRFWEIPRGSYFVSFYLKAKMTAEKKLCEHELSRVAKNADMGFGMVAVGS